jgi:hypothetical protein
LQTSLFPSLHCMPFFGPCPENGFLSESRKKGHICRVKVYSLLLSCITLKQFCSSTYVKFSFLHALYIGSRGFVLFPFKKLIFLPHQATQLIF